MTPEEIVNALQREDWSFMHEAADLIKWQAKALEEAEKVLSNYADVAEWNGDEYAAIYVTVEDVAEVNAVLANIRAMKGE